ncbi:hypothetical protein EV644_104130 [Kribbella orskensis]|uniref:Uncharacterized protein n=1 Tax=Kribbella orskensis TaxID=2512216 RepID=A0ABY2BPG1_9ACTN|nr:MULTISPECIES: hypothetical protein [Kribbella]TCN41748.1 hypothetical protein EV642_103130 [Kribbella sp. VKM Ac-2500]TCO25626.1 hypothetical protein EV644_104130 [Kribbella orskensis]
MFGFRLSAQKPPDARRVTDGVVMRFDHIYEVDPDKMAVFGQQDIPAWDTHRIVDSRWDHLAWMHQHFADKVLGMPDLGLNEDGTVPEAEHAP